MQYGKACVEKVQKRYRKYRKATEKVHRKDPEIRSKDR